MNFEQGHLAYDEIEINVKRILKQCKKRSAWIIGCALLCGLFFAGIMYLKELNTYNERRKEVNIEDFTDTEKGQIETYLIVKEKIRRLETYGEKSPIMQMNSENVYQWSATYYVNSNSAIGHDVGILMVDYMSSTTFKELLCKKLELEEIEYVKDIVNADIKDYSSGVFFVEAIGIDEEETLRWATAIKSILQSYSLEMEDIIGTYTLEIIREEVNDGYVEKVADAQKANVNELSLTNTALTALFGNFSEKVQNYLLGAEDELVKPVIQIKYFLLGNIVGLFVIILGCVLCTVFDGRLQSEQEIQKRLGIMCFGSTANKRNQILYMCTCLLQYLNSENCQTLNFVSTNDILSCDRMEEVIMWLQEKGITCMMCGNILENRESIEKIGKNGPVILVETIGKTKVQDLYCEATICKDLGTKVLGYINVEEE